MLFFSKRCIVKRRMYQPVFAVYIALGLGCNASFAPGACAAWQLARRPLRPPRIPLSAVADHRFGLVQAGAGTRRAARISVAPRSETFGESDFGKCGAGQVFACRVVPAPAELA